MAVAAIAVAGFGIWWLGVTQPNIEPAGMVIDPAAMIFTGDGKTLIAGGADRPTGSYKDTYGVIRRWDVASGRQIGQPLQGYASGIQGMGLTPDGRTLAALESRGGIRLWDMTSGQPVALFGDSTYNTVRLAMSPDGRIIAGGDKDGAITLWDTRHGWPAGWPFDHPLTGHRDTITALVFSADGKILASGCQDGTVRLWNVATGQPLAGHNAAVRALAFSPDGKLLASAGDDKVIRLWDTATGQPVTQPPLAAKSTNNVGAVQSLAFSPDGKALASGSWEGAHGPVRLWDMFTGEQIGQPLGMETGPMYVLVFSPDGKLLASAGTDHAIHLWDMTQVPPTSRTLQ